LQITDGIVVRDRAQGRPCRIRLPKQPDARFQHFGVNGDAFGVDSGARGLHRIAQCEGLAHVGHWGGRHLHWRRLLEVTSNVDERRVAGEREILSPKEELRIQATNGGCHGLEEQEHVGHLGGREIEVSQVALQVHTSWCAGCLRSRQRGGPVQEATCYLGAQHLNKFTHSRVATGRDGIVNVQWLVGSWEGWSDHPLYVEDIQNTLDH